MLNKDTLTEQDRTRWTQRAASSLLLVVGGRTSRRQREGLPTEERRENSLSLEVEVAEFGKLVWF